MKFSYLKRIMLFLCVLALGGNLFAQTTISLGTANQFAVMGRYVHLHNCTITGNAAIGNGTVCAPAPPYDLRFESPGILNGTAYTQTGAIVDGQTSNASGGIVVNDPMVTQAFADAMTAYNNALTLTADQTLASVNSPATITATHNGQYVIHITGNITSQLILNPYSSGVTKFIVIVDGTITLGGSDIVGASSAAGAKDVLIVVNGTGNILTSHIDNFIYGTVLAPYRGAEFHGFAGAMIAGCEYVKYQSGAQISWVPFEPLPPTGTCLGLAARYGILGLDNGTVIINSATNLRAWVGYSDGVVSTTNQKVDNFIGKVEVHTGATFNYVPATFNPSLGIYTTGYDDSLDIANADALYASNNYAGMPVDQTFGNVTSSLTINRTDNVTVVQMGSLNYNSQTLTLVGLPGQDDAFVINVLGNFTFADSKIVLQNVRPERVVFNFPNNSTIDLYKATNVFYGTILAPTGNVTYHNPAVFEGAIIAKNINLHSDFNLTQRSLDIPCETPSTASLGDFIWNDLNHNGIQDAGEPGIQGVTVELHKCSDNSLVATTITNSSGYYIFNNLPAGQYYVKVIIPGGYNVSPQNAGLNDAVDSDINSSGVTGCYTLAAGEVNLTVDGGLYQPQVLLGSLGDFVWNDLNHNGIQDAGEPGIQGVPVELHDGTGAVIKTTVTDANGFYTFTDLPAGQYYVVFTPPADYTISPENQGLDDTKDSDINNLGQTATITLAAGENNPTIDAGMYLPSQPASLGDFVWNDENHNGIQDAADLGIPGVTVNLYACNSNTVLQTTTTDANGYYHFTNLVPGSYYVQFVLPSGYTFTTQNAGTNDALDSDANPANAGKTDCYTLVAGETNNTVDAGMYTTPPAKASLGDFIWLDANMNGIQDAGELGIPNVTVELHKCSDNSLVATTTTNASGIYSFTNLDPGSYYIKVIKPANYTISPVNQGSDDTKDSDIGTDGQSACVTLAAGETNLTLDAGMYPTPPQPAALGDFVWNDTNHNGIQDQGEPGIPNVTVYLYACNTFNVLQSTTTASDGSYHFTGLNPGSYYVQFVLPSGYTFTTPNAGADNIDSDANPADAGKTGCYTLVAGETNNTVDAGMYPTPPNTASLGDFIWNDVNQNGIQDAGELGIPNVTVELHRCSDGSLVATTTINPSGIYTFTNLTPGGYYIKVIVPAGYSISPAYQGSDPTKDSNIGQDAQSACITLAAGENNMTIDAGLYTTPPAPASIGDFVWNDVNHNGIQDQGEAGIPGVTVNLYACNGNTVLQTTTTDASGFYHFTNLTPGSYYVQFVLPAGYTYSPMNAGTNDAVDSDADPNNLGKTGCYTLAAGENNTTVDAGMYPTPQAPASLGDFVWLDSNHNGIQEAGELGLPNVTVQLYKCSDNSLVATTTTNPGGMYLFSNLAPGDYYIKVLVPTGYSVSPANQGTDDAKDSDIGNDGKSACVTLAAGENNMTVDAGLYPTPPAPASIGDFVWNDINHNGIQDQGEPGIPGVTVELYKCIDNSFVSSTTTDANGAYHFTGLTPDGYYVKFILPSGYTFSPMNAGADNVDSDADGAQGGKTACYTLAAGETNNTVDAGMYPTPQQTASLGDFIWNDLNHNGIQDAGEPGLPGITVELHKCSDHSLVATTTTNANGLYSFTNLPAGDYYIKVLAPAGYSISPAYQGSDPSKDSNIGSDAQSACITLAAGENNMTIDAGLYTTPPQTACIGDFVWNDTNHNGIQDAGEAGIQGITIQLYKCSDNSLVAQTVSVGNGFYSFCDIPAGSYYVKFITTGWTVSPANQGSDDARDSDIGTDGKTACFDVVAGQNNYTVDAGLYPPTPGNNGCVGDFVWNDLNHNGIQDINEPGISGVTVELHDCATHALVATTVTNMFGHYQFYNVPAGSYYVKVNIPAGYNVSPINQGSNDEKDSDIGGDGQSACFNVVAGVANNSIDAGLYTTPQNLACIGDFVWLDLNHNGIQDANEPGLYGVTVALYRCSDNSLVAWTTTNYFGQYSFPNIPAGDYYVKFTVPAGYTVSPALQGGNQALDSNPDATGKTACFTVAGGTSNVTIDAGMYPTPSDKGSIGDFVWKDLNGNGIQDANEPGIPGVTVELRKCSDHSLVATTTTDATGHYTFANIPAGSYFVKIIIPAGYTVSPINQGSNDALDSDFGSDGQTACFDVVGGVANNTIDAGLVPPVTTDLEVTKSASKLFLQCGENFTYTVTVKNLGPVSATAVVVTDVEPAGADFASATASQGTYDMATGIWQVGNLAVGATATLTLNSVVDCTELSTTSLTLGPAAGYNVFALNDLNQSATSIQGKAAIGGNATMSGYSTIGSGLAPNSGNVLIVGGNLTMVNGTVENGNVTYGGTTNLPQPSVTIPGGTLTHATPVDFAAAQAALNSLSNALKGYGANGTTAFQWGTLTLNGSDPMLNVFNVSGSDLSAANNFVINVPNGSVAVVNISGQNPTWAGGMSLNGADASKVIFNFFQAQTLKIQGLTVQGTILAPLAALDFPSGIISGQAIVKSLTGAGQFCNAPFSGTIPASKSFTNTAMFTGSSPVDVTVANNSSSVTVTVGAQPPDGGGTQPPICQFDGRIVAFAFDGCNMYAATEGGKVYRSSDGGQTWQPFSEGLDAAYIWALTVVDGTVFAATEKGVYAFNGTRWILVGCGNYDVHDLVGCGGALYAATWGHGIQKSTDYGLNWLPWNTGLPGTPYIQSLSAVEGYIYAATLGSGIYRLACGETTWMPVSTPGQSFWTIAGCQNYLYAASYGDGLFQSCDGTTWNPVTTLPCSNISSIDVAPCGKVIVSSLMGGVFCSADHGATWTNLGFGGGNVCAVYVNPSSEEVYLGTKTGEVFRLNGLLTGVEGKDKVPTVFSLSQNYPNPFNPTTTIEFAIPVAGKYTLKIYDMLGQEVATLLNKELSVGYHKAAFDASRISSGMYIYRLSGTNVQMIKKMMLVK